MRRAPTTGCLPAGPGARQVVQQDYALMRGERLPVNVGELPRTESEPFRLGRDLDPDGDRSVVGYDPADRRPQRLSADELPDPPDQAGL